MKKSVMKKVLSFVLLVLFLSVSSIVLAIPSEPPVSDPNGPYTGNVGFPVYFDGLGSSDPEGSLLTYDWNYGDGSLVAIRVGPTPTHTYAAPGTYTVRLTVTDDFGNTDEMTTTADITRIDPEISCPVPSSSVDYSLTSCDESDFVDISGTGTEAPTASNSDDGGDIVPLGFSFGFYGDAKSEVGISSNGYLTFGPNLSDFSNDPIPTGNDPNDLIAPLWDDLSPDQGGSVHYQSDGSSFIAQWTIVPQFIINDENTFQAVLYNGSNAIVFRYGDFTPEGVAGDYTVGIENAAGTAGINISAATIQPGFCIQLTPSTPFPYLDIKPGSNPNCVNIRSGGVIPVTLLGRDDFDVYDIDIGTLTLGGETPLRCAYEDVYPGDGIVDLSCRFKKKDLTWPDFSVDPSNCALMTVYGDLLDGTPFEAVDWVCEAGGSFCENGTPTAVCNEETVEACCLPDDTCAELAPDECAAQGGLSHGPGSNCANVECGPPDLGACCLPDDECTEMLSEECFNAGGFLHAPGADCTEVYCPPPPDSGACCWPDGGCTEGSFDLCIGDGVPKVPGSECDIETCPQPSEPEACCWPDGGCTEGPPDACVSKGGFPNGPGSICELAECLDPN
jgi:hypothetical protein